jgi:hypothetical protein
MKAHTQIIHGVAEYDARGKQKRDADGEPISRTITIEPGSPVDRKDLPGLSDEAWQQMADAGSVVEDDAYDAMIYADKERERVRAEQLANSRGFGF